MLRNGQHFVAAVFDGTRFMGGNMAGLGGNDTFIGLQHGINDGLVGLGAAGQKPDIGFRAVACSLNLFFRTFAIRIAAIAGQRLQVGFYKTRQNFLMSAFLIIVLK